MGVQNFLYVKNLGCFNYQNQIYYKSQFVVSSQFKYNKTNMDLIHKINMESILTLTLTFHIFLFVLNSKCFQVKT